MGRLLLLAVVFEVTDTIGLHTSMIIISRSRSRVIAIK